MYLLHSSENWGRAYYERSARMKKVSGTTEKKMEKTEWVFTVSQIELIEKETDAPEIWVISSDLKDDAAGGSFQKIVSANLKRGISYRFFVPDSSVIKRGIETLVAHNKKAENLKVTFLNEDYFFLVPVFDFVIYNPLKKKGAERTGFMGIETPDGTMLYSARVGDSLIEAMIRKLKKCIKE